MANELDVCATRYDNRQQSCAESRRDGEFDWYKGLLLSVVRGVRIFTLAVASQAQTDH